MSVEEFRVYFLSHNAFVVRRGGRKGEKGEKGREKRERRKGDRDGREGCMLMFLYSMHMTGEGEEDGGAGRKGEEGGRGDEEASVLGTFYIKPNFPDRCAHICNGGFITEEKVHFFFSISLRPASLPPFLSRLPPKA